MKYNQLFGNYNGVFRYLTVSKWLTRQPLFNSLVGPFLKRRVENGAWRSYGLKRDDLIIEEHDVVQEALKRLPKDQLHARYQRFKVALHYSMLRKPLPKEQWIQNEEDYAYLMPYIEQVLAEHEEKEKYDTGLFKRQH